MTDDKSIEMEKVVKGLKCLAQMKAPTCKDCAYSDRLSFAICVKDITSDALVLLKEQEPVEPLTEFFYW